jgi:hypothetical protein
VTTTLDSSGGDSGYKDDTHAWICIYNRPTSIISSLGSQHHTCIYSLYRYSLKPCIVRSERCLYPLATTWWSHFTFSICNIYGAFIVLDSKTTLGCCKDQGKLAKGDRRRGLLDTTLWAIYIYVGARIQITLFFGRTDPLVWNNNFSFDFCFLFSCREPILLTELILFWSVGTNVEVQLVVHVPILMPCYVCLYDRIHSSTM